MPKSQKRNTIISIVLTLIAFVLFVSVALFEELAELSMIIMIAGLVLLAASWAVYFMSGKTPPKEEAENVITVIACRSCGQVEERSFAQGDYIFKDMGQCKKCSGPSFIKSIYSVSPKKE
ncbi:MAG: hypothetical protein ACQXXL_07640 [Candidatus Methanosuratincola sp.]|nr:hypothetical protein [Candidatus Methanosuratincola sp.]